MGREDSVSGGIREGNGKRQNDQSTLCACIKLSKSNRFLKDL